MYICEERKCNKCNTPIIESITKDNIRTIKEMDGCRLVEYTCPKCGETYRVTDMYDEVLFKKKEASFVED